jgi:VIT1/CCC1 family predicted Fe2+/Mn2+ transporter
MTFALTNNRLVALSAIIIGVSATLSMMASNYLAERANGSGDAVKSSTYVGVAYIVTVALLVMPYLLFPENMFLPAFFVMILLAIVIIFAFNYYISVAKDEPFLHRFVEMTLISLAVAVISFGIALLAKQWLGVDAM